MNGLPYEYALLRVVPRVDRGEFVNVGVLVYCQDADRLDLRTAVDEERLRALHPDLDIDAVRAALAAVRAVCDGTPGAGEAGQQPLGVRFRWLTAPRSTLVQPGPVHAGVTTDPVRRPEELLARLVG